MIKSLLRMFRKDKSQPRRNTPWLGWRPGQASKAFELAFVKRERKPSKPFDKLRTQPEPTRSILWTIPGGQCRVLQVAL